jgi:RimJ/RimL family protein N-acetyltransferase
MVPIDMIDTPKLWEGNNTVLRPFKKSNKERVLVWRRDLDIVDAQLGCVFPVTTVMEERWFAIVMDGQANDRVTFAIYNKEDDTLIGFISLSEIDWIPGTAQYSITIGDRSYNGRGFGREATELILAYAFNTLNLRRIWLQVAGFNIRAIDLYEKMGFILEGTLKNHLYRPGELHDLLIMGLFRNTESAKVN